MGLGKEQTVEGFVKNIATGSLVSVAPIAAGIALNKTSSFIRSFTQSGAIHRPIPVDPRWRSSVEDFIDTAEYNGFKVRGTEVTVKTPLGNRKIDVILESPDGRIGGIELKSTESEFVRFSGRAREQFAKDNWINMYGGRATGENAAKAGVDRVDYMMKILWK